MVDIDGVGGDVGVSLGEFSVGGEFGSDGEGGWSCGFDDCVEIVVGVVVGESDEGWRDFVGGVEGVVVFIEIDVVGEVLGFVEELEVEVGVEMWECVGDVIGGGCGGEFVEGELVEGKVEGVWNGVVIGLEVGECGELDIGGV